MFKNRQNNYELFLGVERLVIVKGMPTKYLVFDWLKTEKRIPYIQ